MKNLHIKIAAYMLVFLIVGCGGPEELAIQAAKADVAKLMKDPESAKFSDVFVVFITEKGKYPAKIGVCGMVNGKNSFGAYAGASRFASTVFMSSAKDAAAIGGIESLMEASTFQEVYWNRTCVQETTQVKK